MSGDILNWINKWRHTRGYGVHSPLAFRIVTDCLYPNSEYGLYSDSFVDFEFCEDRKMRRNVKRLMRLINLLKPTSIWMPEADPRIVEAIGISFPALQVSSDRILQKTFDFIVCVGDSPIEEMWQKMKECPELGMICLNTDCKKFLPVIPDASLIMRGNDYCIFLRRIGMQKTEYKLL